MEYNGDISYIKVANSAAIEESDDAKQHWEYTPSRSTKPHGREDPLDFPELRMR